MSQQINLFNPIFLKQKKYFSAVTMAQALGLILCGAALLSAYTNYRVAELAREADATSMQLASAQAQLNKLTAEFGSRQKSAMLEEQAKVAESEVAGLKQVVGILTRGEFGNTNGYSEYMRAFSRQIVPGLWLTGFNVSGAGSEIALQGRALRAELVPAYISKLKRESVLQGKSFAALEMQLPIIAQPANARPASPPASQGSTPAYIEFNLQSSQPGNDDDNAGAKSK